MAAGHTQRGVASLEAAGIETHVFDQLHENPSTDDVQRGVKIAARYEPEILVGLGGGSSMDCTKGVNFVYSNGGEMKDYWGVGKALKPMLPMIAVPTTAGTGSETQSFALISDAQTHAKMACGDKKASCRVAILDAELTVTQPDRVTALTGIDALVHAVETYVTKPRNPVSVAFSRESFRLLSSNFHRVLDAPDDLEARGAMLLGASFAGMAIENSMLGAAHALANPLTARFGLVHGQAVGMMLPHVIRFNGQDDAVARWFRELWRVRDDAEPIAVDDAAERMAELIDGFVRHAGLLTRLSDCGVPRADLAKLADSAAQQWTGGFNPRPVAAPEMLSLYELAF